MPCRYGVRILLVVRCGLSSTGINNHTQHPIAGHDATTTKEATATAATAKVQAAAHVGQQ